MVNFGSIFKQLFSNYPCSFLLESKKMGLEFCKFLTSFHDKTLVSFYTPGKHLKTSAKLCFSDIFRGYRKRAVAWNRWTASLMVNFSRRKNHLANLLPMYPFSIPWKHQKTVREKSLNAAWHNYIKSVKPIFLKRRELLEDWFLFSFDEPVTASKDLSEVNDKTKCKAVVSY